MYKNVTTGLVLYVNSILEAPTLKNGSGRELRYLHDIVNQNVRAISAMKYDTFESFVTAIIELKLDQTTMFEWQRHTQEDKSIPPCSELLSFLDLRARASENVKQEPPKRVVSGRDKSTPKSYTVSIDDLCAACKASRHPLFACNVFQALPHAKKLAVVRNNNICLNCLRAIPMVRLPRPGRC